MTSDTETTAIIIAELRIAQAIATELGKQLKREIGLPRSARTVRRARKAALAIAELVESLQPTDLSGRGE